MEQRKDKKKPILDLISYLLNGVFLKTVGSYGGFFVDKNGHIVENPECEAEPEDIDRAQDRST
ncbi:MAG: hypothetical protein VB099_14130 [Candidatus Limiplasma sp.]|nr:hypothetical protein [Candidatus Limiplasma sp.]